MLNRYLHGNNENIKKNHRRIFDENQQINIKLQSYTQKCVSIWLCICHVPIRAHQFSMCNKFLYSFLDVNLNL